MALNGPAKPARSCPLNEADRKSLGRVGNSGNTSAPHLHFHVMDGPSPLASHGLPYVIDSFTVTGAIANTPEADEAVEDGAPVPMVPMTPHEVKTRCRSTCSRSRLGR